MEDVEREEEAGKSSLLTSTDHRAIAVIAFIIVAAMVYAFFVLRENARYQACQENMNHIGKALGLYMSDNEGGLPPAFISDGKGGVALDARGLPRTWVIGALPYATDASIFTCPSAGPDEYTYISDSRPGKTGVIKLTYAMFGPMGSANKGDLDGLRSSALIVESVPGGKQESYDPLPLAGGNDGFVIGFNNTDTSPTRDSLRLTRLAIRVDDPRHPKLGTGTARHASHGVVVLYAGLSCGNLDPDDMFVVHAKQGVWASPGK